MRKKYLLLLLVTLVIALAGCGKKKYVAPPPVPITPSNLTAAAISQSQINLNWKDNSTTEKGFYLYSRTTDDYARVAIMEANATSYNDSGLMSETTYQYKVTSYNDQGESGPSNEVSATTSSEPPPPLEPPSNVEARAASYKQINLSWKDNSDDEDSFRITCDMGIGQNQFLARVPANTTRYEHGNLQPMTQYKYYVVAERGEESATSEQVISITFCPVEVRAEGVNYLNEKYVEVYGRLWSSASEPCRAEIRIGILDEAFNEIASKKQTFSLPAFGEDKFEIRVDLPSSQEKVYPTHEITDVEILY